MPTYPGDIQDKLDDLQALTGADRKPAELVVIYWPTPAGTKVYASAMYTELPWWPDLAAAITTYFGTPIPITLTLIPDGTPFIDLPRAASISDDSINLTFSDLDDEFSDLLMDYGEGIRTEVFCYWPTVDLLLSMWRGMLHQPKEMNRDQVKITATSGWRAPQMLVPKRPHATSCPFIFGALLTSQAEIDYHNGCPYNVHIGGAIGVPGFTDCPRRVKADCVERLATEVYWPAFETRPDPIPNNQTQGPNLLARAIGNESNLNDPVRAIFGERYIKAANLLAFRNETDTNHPEDGFFAGLFEFGEGPLLALWEFRMMDQLVGAEHFQLRLGELGQPPSDWSPDVNSYSGTAHGYGRIQGESDNATASDYSASIRALGDKEVRVYSDENTFVEAYTTNRVWCLLKVLANARWGYGQDYPRFDIQSFIDAAAWCDEFIALTDSNGNIFSGVRSTFNAEVTARAIQQQVKDICTAGRLGIPFEFEGRDVIVPLKAEDVDDANIPAFTDEGANRNIVYDGAKSSLSWSVISDETMTNQCTVNFDDASNGGVDTQYIFGDQAQQLRAGRAWGDRSKRVVSRSQAGYGINSDQEAARFGNSLLYLGPLDSGGILNPFSVKFTTWYASAFNVQNYRLIRVVNAKLQSRMTAYFTARGLEPYPDADYTHFRVMKYTRKGDLRVEIEAQQYATLDIVLSEPVCDVPVVVATIGNSFLNEVEYDLTELLPLTEGDLLLGFLFNGDPGNAPATPDGWEPIPNSPFESDFATTGFFTTIWGFRKILGAGETGVYSFDNGLEIDGWAANFIECRDVDPDDPISAVSGAANGNATPTLTLPSVTTAHDNSLLLVATANQISEQPTVAGFTNRATGSFLYYFDLEQETAGPSGDVDVVSANLSGTGWDIGFLIALNPNCEGVGGDTFSAPRDFTAVVNSTTGVVHFHWSPPSVHPELVTGYVVYESDGATVVMPAALVYEHELTLAPGTYSYRLRATDGATFSGYVSVTFTVAEPPVTGADLFVIDDLTLENVFDDLTIEQVTV